MTRHTPKSLIGAVGKLLSDRRRWCQGALARARNGNPITISRGYAFDPIGAAYYLASVSLRDESWTAKSQVLFIALAAMSEASHLMHQASVEKVNDERGYEAIMDVLRLAYKQAADEIPGRASAA